MIRGVCSPSVISLATFSSEMVSVEKSIICLSLDYSRDNDIKARGGELCFPRVIVTRKLINVNAFVNHAVGYFMHIS